MMTTRFECGRSNRRSISTLMLVLGIAMSIASAARADNDHLEGYKIKDGNAETIALPGLIAMQSQFGLDACELKKAQFFLVQGQKNGGDDPRGGAAGNFVCYKAKCSADAPPTTTGTSQFGNHSLQPKKGTLVCLPLDNEPTPPQCPASGGDSGACLESGTASSLCEACCTANAGCNTACTTARSSACTNAAANDACGAAANAAGCDVECCP